MTPKAPCVLPKYLTKRNLNTRGNRIENLKAHVLRHSDFWQVFFHSYAYPYINNIADYLVESSFFLTVLLDVWYLHAILLHLGQSRSNMTLLFFCISASLYVSKLLKFTFILFHSLEVSLGSQESFQIAKCSDYSIIPHPKAFG